MNENERPNSGSAQKNRQPGKIKRALFIVAGTISLGLGVVGIFLPIVPTTPLFLLAAACYYKGSKRLHRWLLNNKWVGKYIQNYMQGKGISLKAKIFTVSLLWITISFSALFLIDMLIVQIILFIVAIAVSIHVVMLPTFRGS